MGHDSVVGPGLQTPDIALSREFNVTERAEFEFRDDFFNALNHMN